MYINSSFIRNFYPIIKEEENEEFMQLNQEVLERLSPKILKLLWNQGTYERQYQMYMIDDEEARQIKEQETGEP